MKELLVFGEKTFKVKVPDDCRITFGPWSPPSEKATNFNGSERALSGTLRIYQGGTTKANETILAVFSGVRGFRDLSLDYSEQVVIQEGSTIWKDDKKGYVRESKVEERREWDVPELEKGEEPY